jgi:hypothetical protein
MRGRRLERTGGVFAGISSRERRRYLQIVCRSRTAFLGQTPKPFSLALFCGRRMSAQLMRVHPRKAGDNLGQCLKLVRLRTSSGTSWQPITLPGDTAAVL